MRAAPTAPAITPDDTVLGLADVKAGIANQLSINTEGHLSAAN
jgi:hypothetical protein